MSARRAFVLLSALAFTGVKAGAHTFYAREILAGVVYPAVSIRVN
ncbi:MAG TPA: hypothetical protein VF998_04055 [Candidatus Limnocylindria bacterium]